MKQTKIYSSYEEINRDLAIYTIERELYLEKMKMDVENVKSELTVKKMISGYLGFNSTNTTNWVSRTTMTVLPWVIQRVWKRFK